MSTGQDALQASGPDILEPLGPPPSTREMVTYLARVLPAMDSLSDAARMQVADYSGRLHERGIDPRTFQPIESVTPPVPQPEDRP